MVMLPGGRWVAVVSVQEHVGFHHVACFVALVLLQSEFKRNAHVFLRSIRWALIAAG